MLDDGSTDGTADIARAAAQGDRRVRVLAGGPLYEGWKGKPNALRQLAASAKGDVLLLTDADCTFLPRRTRRRRAPPRTCRRGLPFAHPRPRLRLVLGARGRAAPVRCRFLDAARLLTKVTLSVNPAFAAANGAFLLLPAATYRALGGHEAVRAEMAEDIKFAQHVKRQGRRPASTATARASTSVRMYDSLRGVWDGFLQKPLPGDGTQPSRARILVRLSTLDAGRPVRFRRGRRGNGRPRAVITMAARSFRRPIALLIRLAVTLRFRQARFGR